MKYILIISIAVILVSCSSGDEPSAFVDVSIELSVLDIDGNDLLNPNNDDSFKESDIKLYYVINEEKREVYDPNMQYPRNFFIFKEGAIYRIRLLLNNDKSDDKPITYIQWNDKDSDTISAEFYRTNNLTRKEKVWFNDKLIYEFDDNTSESFYKLTK
ncbi:hypothetical protein [Marinifilum caeruleilacunae]|uniref:Lipoprotein n=1 Tax=Marinifilum caeruleilacunae TaxID=2499076 RepID=A0ABX1X0Z4_9BACT|nr:hypothetical protein [Marinifilum caeruleilacunae]NOU62083.1 hypothetical protein [Marinifilum caeruleilacunae]